LVLVKVTDFLSFRFYQLPPLCPETLVATTIVSLCPELPEVLVSFI